MKRQTATKLGLVLVAATLIVVLSFVATQAGLAAAIKTLAADRLTQMQEWEPASGGYSISWWTVDGGGATYSTDGSYTLAATAGQHDAVVWVGSGYSLTGGFWGRSRAEARQQAVYLPLVRIDLDTWEQEPNDAPEEANGPVLSGPTYYGTMPIGDANDYFAFAQSITGTAELWLTHIPENCNYDLVLRNEALEVVGYSGELGNSDEHILVEALPAGPYFIQVYHRGESGSDQPYHLQVTYPCP